jgi:integrase
MATIIARQTKKGLAFVIRIRMKGTVINKTLHCSKREAQKWAALKEAEILQENEQEDNEYYDDYTVSQMISKFMREAHGRLKSAEFYGQGLAYLDEFMGSQTLSKVRRRDILAYRDWLLQKKSKNNTSTTISKSSVNRYVAYARAAFSKAIEWEWIETNPCTHIKKFTEPKRNRFLRQEELKLFLDACKESPTPIYTVVLIALTTGTRKNNILNMKWEWVDLENNLIHWPTTKTGRSATKPMLGFVKEELLKWWAERGPKVGLCFPGKRKPHQPYDLKTAWKKAIDKSGIQDFCFHDQRHTNASYNLMSGASTKVVAEFLSSDLQNTDRYAHLTTDHMVEQAEKMAEKFILPVLKNEN